MTDLTFDVAAVIEKLAASEKINLICEGIDDTCNGLTVMSDVTLVDFLNQHKGPYNFRIADGDPIRIVRRSIGDDLVIDLEIDQSECISPGHAQPVIKLSRIDPQTLPGQIELSYIDPDRGYTSTTQVARYRHRKLPIAAAGALLVPYSDTVAVRAGLSQSVSLMFSISADQARQMAFDYLARLWSQATSVEFEHPNIAIEAADVLQLTTNAGILTVIVDEQTITPQRTNQIKATVLLTSSGIAIAGGVADAYSPSFSDDFAAWHFAQ